MGAKDWIGSVAGKAASQARSIAEDAGDRAAAMADEGRDKAAALAEQGRDKAADLIEDGRDTAASLVDKGRAGATSLVDKGLGWAGDTVDVLALRVPEVLSGLGRPAVPLQSGWEIGFGRLAADLLKVPDGLRPLTGRLDGVGALAISPDTVTIDGTAVKWKDVTEITFGTAPDAFTANVGDKFADDLTAALPAIPGRAWLVRQAIDTLLALGLVIMERTPIGLEDGPADVLMSVKYKGRIGKKELKPGLFALQISSFMPEVAAAFSELATRNGVSVVVSPPSRSASRADTMRALVGKLRAGAAELPMTGPEDPADTD